jgi:hypothetical protein
MMLQAAGMAVATLAAAVAFGVASRSRAFLGLMVAYALLLVLAGTWSLLDSLPNAHAGTPQLMGSDGEGYFEEASLLAQAGIDRFPELIASNYAGYQAFLAVLFTIVGSHLAVGLAANFMLLLASAWALHGATQLLTGSKRAALLAAAAYMLTPTNIYYALLLLKEPAIGLAFALVLLSVTSALQPEKSGHRPWVGPLVMFALAFGILAVMRALVLPFVLLVLGFAAPLFARGRSALLLVLAAAVVLLAPLAQQFSTLELDRTLFAETVTLNTVIATTLDDGEVDAGGVVGRISGLYLDLPFAAKLALFPIPTLLQLLLPFDFWSTRFIDEHGASLFARNLNPLWFLFVAVWALFALRHWRRASGTLLRRFLLAGAAFYVLIAVVYGGAIPRYAAPALFFVYPAIGYWWDRSLAEPAIRAQVRGFFLRYYLCIPLALLPYLALNLLRQL